MFDNQQQNTSKVDKPGTSTVKQFDVQAIPKKDITDDDLEQSGENSQNWLLYGNNYRRHHHTTADVITTDNVSNLQREWTIDSFETDTRDTGMQGSPVVISGDPPVMYQTNGAQTVRALNARTGELLWRYVYEPKSGYVSERPPASRGTAVLGDTLYYSTLDFGLVALDRYTADEKWYYNGAYRYRDMSVSEFQGGRWMGDDDPNTAMHPELSYVKDRGSSSAFPPLVHDGVILKGSFGGEVGVSGWAEGIPTDEKRSEMGTATAETSTGTAAEETATGTPSEASTGTATETPSETSTEMPAGETATATTPEAAVGGDHNTPVWRLQMTPEDDWVGESWKHGGSTVWQAGALDIETGTAVIPTSNPAPWFGTVRPGWNPYSAGKVAIDFQSGDVQWNYQEVPHDWWDYDSPSPAFIYDTKIDGNQRRLASWAGKTGWVFTTDLKTGELVERSVPFTEHLNMYDLPAKSMEDAEWILPSLSGGTDPQPSAYDPKTRTMVVKGYNTPMKMAWEPIEYTLGKDYKGIEYIQASTQQQDQIDGWNEPIGTVSGLDPVTGEIKWQNWYDSNVWGGAMTTATGLTFAGISDGTFFAYDTRSGDVAWKDQIGTGVDGNPVSWVDPGTNKQYVMIQAGGSQSGGDQKIVTYSMEQG